MKEIKFRPLRIIKKTGKITVAAYSQWRRIKTSDYNMFTLIIDERYKSLAEEDFVYNNLGQQLFFYDFKPNDIIINPKIPRFENWIPSDMETAKYLEFRKKYPYILLDKDNYKTFWCRGLDVDGVPIFNYNTADYIATHYDDMMCFTPLTVKTVKLWFGWFLYQLENYCLK